MLTKTIELYTWNPIWIYWPMYVALGKTLHDLNHGLTSVAGGEAGLAAPSVSKRLQLSIQLRCPSRVETDAAIRDEFFERLRLGDRMVMALCEPPRSCKEDKAAGLPSLRKVSLLMRLPHWLLRPVSAAFPNHRDLPVSSTLLEIQRLADAYLGHNVSDRLFALPPETTSGDYARCIKQQLGKYLPPDFHVGKESIDERALIEGSICGDQWTLLCFTPWHYAQLKNAASQIVAIGEFSGPLRDVTALFFPHDIFPDAADSKLFYKILNQHVSRTLGALHATHGIPERVEEKLIKWEEQGYLRWADNALKSSAHLHKDLPVFLAAYIRRCCYFPAQIIWETIGDELDRLVADQQLEVAALATTGTQKAIREAFGKPRRWDDLNFEQRFQVQRQKADRWLWHYAIHERANAEKVLQETHVVWSDDEPVPLDHLRPRKMPFSCDDDKLNDKLFCDRSEICFCCHISGMGHALLNPAASRLEEALRNAYESQSREFDKLVTRESLSRTVKCPSLLTWDDVEGFIDVFVQEARSPRGANSRRDRSAAHVVIAHREDSPETSRAAAAAGKSNIRLDPRCNTLFAVLWSGSDTAPNSLGTGNAGRELIRWAQDRARHGKAPSCVAYGECQGRMNIVYPDNYALDTDPSWQQVRALARERGYHFAYVTCFDTRHLAATER